MKRTDVADIADLDYVVCRTCKRLSPIENVPSQPIRLGNGKTPPTWKVERVLKSEIRLEHKGYTNMEPTVNTDPAHQFVVEFKLELTMLRNAGVISFEKFYEVEAKFDKDLAGMTGAKRMRFVCQQLGNIRILRERQDDIDFECPRCHETHGCCCWIDTSAPVEILPGEQLP